MTRLLGALQIVAMTLQAQPVPVPPAWDRWYHATLAVIQALGWWAQRGYNPDSTPAAVAYQKPEK